MKQLHRGYFSQQFNQCFSSQKPDYVATLIQDLELQKLKDTIQKKLEILDTNTDNHLQDFTFMSKVYTKIRKLRLCIPLYRNEEKYYPNEKNGFGGFTSYVPQKIENNFPISKALKKLEKSLIYFFNCAEKKIPFKQALAAYNNHITILK